MKNFYGNLRAFNDPRLNNLVRVAVEPKSPIVETTKPVDLDFKHLFLSIRKNQANLLRLR